MLDPDEAPSRAGPGDTVLGFKYRLLDETDARPACLGGLTLRLPTGDESRGLGADGFDVGLVLAFGKSFGVVRLTANVGYTFVVSDRRLDVWGLAGSLEYRAGPALSLVAEIVSAFGPRQAPDTAIARVGLFYGLTSRIKLDGAVAAGLTRASPDVVVTVGVTISPFLGARR